MKYYYLYIPAVIFFLLPLVNVLHAAAVARAAAREKEKKRIAAEQAKAEQERAAAIAAEKRKAEQAAAKAARDAEKLRRQQERERKQAEKLEAARQLAEYRERALQAQKELAALERGKTAVAPAAQPEEKNADASNDQPEAPADAMTPEDFADQYAAEIVSKSFQGEKVAFTGKLSSMTRAEAVEKVRQAGGQGYVKEMPVGTTLLVVGTLKGDGCSRKLDKADEWIGQVRKVTEAQFLAMLAA